MKVERVYSSEVHMREAEQALSQKPPNKYDKQGELSRDGRRWFFGMIIVGHAMLAAERVSESLSPHSTDGDFGSRRDWSRVSLVRRNPANKDR